MVDDISPEDLAGVTKFHVMPPPVVDQHIGGQLFVGAQARYRGVTFTQFEGQKVCCIFF